ncbi:MAG: phosphatase PAP2 family protein, partial [Anaerolineaceae bacterium]|nr:phosphatase PAP2 family protein [Anaerolineaceae bacterium]
MTTNRGQDHPLRKNMVLVLRSPGLLAKLPIIGFIMFIFGSLMFAGLTYNLFTQGPLLGWDRLIATTWLAIGLAGSSLLFLSLSNLLGSTRLLAQIWIVENIPGFPSGHAITVVVFYGLLAYLLAPKMPSAFWKGIVIAVAFVIISFVGFSRVFTGGHYLTDALAGYAVGITWVGVAYTLIEVYFHK